MGSVDCSKKVEPGLLLFVRNRLPDQRIFNFHFRIGVSTECVVLIISEDVPANGVVPASAAPASDLVRR